MPQISFSSTDSLRTAGSTVSPTLPATPVHTTSPVVSASEKQLISPALSCASSDSFASSSSDVLSASSSAFPASSHHSSSDTSNVSSVSTMSHTYSATASVDRQSARVAELASEHVAAVQLADRVSEMVKVGLAGTLEKAKKGRKKIIAERQKRRQMNSAQKERALKQEGEHSTQQPIVATVAVIPSANTASQLTMATSPASGIGQAGAVSGSNILQMLLSTNGQVGRKRHHLSENRAVDTIADNEAEEDDDDVGVMSLTSTVPRITQCQHTRLHHAHCAAFSSILHCCCLSVRG